MPMYDGHNRVSVGGFLVCFFSCYYAWVVANIQITTRFMSCHASGEEEEEEGGREREREWWMINGGQQPQKLLLSVCEKGSSCQLK